MDKILNSFLDSVYKDLEDERKIVNDEISLSVLDGQQDIINFIKENIDKFSSELKKSLDFHNQSLKDEIDSYKKILSFYGNKDNYGDRGEYWKIVNDEGERARKILKIWEGVNHR